MTGSSPAYASRSSSSYVTLLPGSSALVSRGGSGSRPVSDGPRCCRTPGGDAGRLCRQRRRRPGGLALPDGPRPHALPPPLLPPPPPPKGHIKTQSPPFPSSFYLPRHFAYCPAQIDKYVMHISRSKDLMGRLSPQEQKYAERYLLRCDCFYYLLILDGPNGN
jgi:hypothetical protein